MNNLPFPPGRRIDLACLGRLAVDLYAQQVGCPLEDATSFAKYLGGSSANIAFGAARLGLRAAMISRVGNEQMGRYLLETLQREGCDTGQGYLFARPLPGTEADGIFAEMKYGSDGQKLPDLSRPNPSWIERALADLR